MCRTVWLSTFLAVFFLGMTFAEENIAVVIKVSGDVRVTPDKSSKSTGVKKGYVLKHGDKLVTGAAAFCALKFLDDGSLLRIKEKSSCRIEGKRQKQVIEKNIFAEIGSFFMSIFKQKENLTVTTPTSVASIKGTKFWVLQLGSSGTTRYVCLDGVIEISNDAGKVLLRKGQTAIVVSRSQLPQVRLTVSGDAPEDEVGVGGERHLDFGFTDSSGKKKTLRIKLKNQE